MIKVLLADDISQRALELLEEIPEFEISVKPGLTREQLKIEIKEYDAVVIRGRTIIDKTILDEAENLKIIVRAGIDLDNVDVQTAQSRNIEVRNTPFAATITVAEYTLAQMLNISRHIGPSYHSLKQKQWKQKDFKKGTELYGKTAGIIGFGRIGREVAKRELAMGMKVLFHDTHPIETDLPVKQVPLDELLRNSDFISIHVPPTSATRNLLSNGQFDLFKKDAVLILISRENVVDENALLQAVNNNKIKAVAVDVHENDWKRKQELIEHPRVYPTPYLGAATGEREERAGVDVYSVLKEFFNV